MTVVTLNEKVSRLIQYINELSQLKQKPIASIKKYDEVLWVSKLPVGAECKDTFNSKIDDWLYVKKPVHPVAPVISSTLQDWVMIDYNKYTFKIRNSITENVSEDEEIVETEIFLKDLPTIEKQIEQFKEGLWDPYVVEAKHVREVQDLYDKLFKMHQNLQLYSESLELVVSTGFLQWNNKSKETVERHLLTSKVELHFNRKLAEFIILPSSKGKVFEYEEDMLLVENRLTGEDSNDIHNLLLELDQDEGLISQMTSILQRIAHALDSQGTYLPILDIPSVQTENPTVSLSPAFVLRKKTQKSFQKACQTAVEQLENITDDSLIPENLTNMFLSSPLTDQEVENGDTSFKEAQEFYFPLPSNEEQNRIISTLNHRSSVLVQGPPGTGKTHTIANLASHLLATGQRVLVTSQTAKALGVLKSKLPGELQDLSVSLLGGDSASMKDLEKVVNTISINKELFNLSEMTATVAKNKTILKNLKSNLNKTKTELMEIREAETYKHNFNTIYKGTAQQIAEKVNQQAHTHNWYTTNVTIETPSTFWEKEKNLVSEYIRIKKTDLEAPVGYDQFDFPSISIKIDLNLIPDLINEESQLKNSFESLKANESEELKKSITSLSNEKILSLKNELQKWNELQRPLLFNSYPSLKNVIDDIFTNRGFIWGEIVQKSSVHLQIIETYQDKFDEGLITTGNLTTAVLKKMTEDLHAHVASGGNLGNIFMKPKVVRQYKEQLQQVTYNGSEIKSKDQIPMLLAYAQTRSAKEQLQQLLIPAFLLQETLNPNTAFSEVQNALSQLTKALHIQDWRNNFLQKNDFLSRDDFNEEMAQALTQNIDILKLKNDLLSKSKFIDEVIIELKDIITEQSHPLYKELIDSIQTREADKICTILSQYNHFQEVMQRDNTLNTIFLKLLKESPSLTNSLEEYCTNPDWEQRLHTWQQAFEWKQTQHWIEQFSMKSESALSSKYDQIEKNIKEMIVEIGTAKAWISMLQTMTDDQSKHLKAWARAVKSTGKGTGKNAARYRSDAQKHMEKCMDAIPAWIMPLHQVYDNFEIRPNLFDVIIIDEASQSWHDALLLNYLAKKLIIVGDDQQISPTIIGITDEDILKLQNKYFRDINFPFGRDLNLKTSFFDISYIMFKDTITLREHFRCMPEIIGFSNLISYRDKPLIPLRQYPAKRLEPLKSVYLPHGIREGSSSTTYNEVEADAIVQEIKNCTENPTYDGKTFGVISLLGENQAKLIQNKLLSELGAEIMEDRKIICGDAYAFQGDERDIIFLSMVVANGATRITALTDDKARQRFNVAASRAKDQLWLMHSITVNDISNRDCLRYQLLSYFANPLKEETESNREKCESNFEKNIFDDITTKGYRVIPQYSAANYRIDLVVQGEKSKLAVECDGDHWHTSVEDRERDFLRERVLQRAGWKFWRVLGSTYYNNPGKALESLWEKIEEMGIRPYIEWNEDSIETRTVEVTENRVIPVENIEVVIIDSEIDILDELEDIVIEEESKKTEVKDAVPRTKKLNKVILPSFFPENDPISEDLLTIPKKENAVKINKENPIILESMDKQTPTVRNPEYDHYKQLLRSEGFEVLQDQPQSNTLYVVGTQFIHKELEYISPKNNSFAFHKDGLPISDEQPVWSITFDDTEPKPTVYNEEIIKADLTEPKEEVEPLSSDSPESMLKDLKKAGYLIIDNRSITETVWLVGGEELTPIIEDFKKHKVIFRYLEKGHSLTHYKPTWFAKMKPLKKVK